MLDALGLGMPKIHEVVKRNTMSLASRICQVPSPVRTLLLYSISKYVMTGTTVAGTMVDRLIKFGVSPLSVVLGSKTFESVCKT